MLLTILTYKWNTSLKQKTDSLKSGLQPRITDRRQHSQLTIRAKNMNSNHSARCPIQTTSSWNLVNKTIMQMQKSPHCAPQTVIREADKGRCTTQSPSVTLSVKVHAETHNVLRSKTPVRIKQARCWRTCELSGPMVNRRTVGPTHVKPWDGRSW